MSGFDTDWLSLREPADKAARAPALVELLTRYLQTPGAPTILDIGCGTGSTWRALERHVPEDTNWLLLDHDPLLLEEAERSIGGDRGVAFRQFNLNDLEDLPLEGVSVVTASALFDLVSEDFCAAFCDRIASQGCGFYAALNYDGVIRWSHRHPLDDDMVDAFNRHQQTDKGFGSALGPGAGDCLERLLETAGYRVRRMPSPWRMDGNAAALQQAFLSGFRQPLREMSKHSMAEIEAWLSFRLSAIAAPESLCEVGHTDIIALPA
ncbi:methyltransferase domain-containing protein [Martelella soudanensis]|uniref:methyltransferase domain-containing protein n=1 Tax=unclassified Martelella TaxID=2629616 RepID=UPI0015DE1D5E|nr:MULTISPECIES: class I SAM-dependent methyltransferase [unclassified Martelella]